MKKFILGLDGMDRTGKSSIGKSGNILVAGTFSDRLGRDFTCFNGHENRYSTVAKECFKDRFNGVSKIVSSGIAIAELLEGIEYMFDYGCDSLIMPRTFVSSLVYMRMRGDYTAATMLMQDIQPILEKFDIGFMSVLLTVSKETMKERGSKDDSYEILYYDQIAQSMSSTTHDFKVPRTHITKLNTEYMGIDETIDALIDEAKRYLDRGGSDMDIGEYVQNFVNRY